jgi:hypothetical protein
MSAEMEILRNNQTEMLEIKNNETEIKDAFHGFICRLDIAEESISLL